MGRESFDFDRNRKWVIVWLVGAIIACTISVATYGHTWRFAYNASITEFAVCSGLDPVSKAPIPVTQPIAAGAKELAVYGYLKGIGPTIPLWIIWEYNEEVFADKDDYYQLGYIEARVKSPGGFKAGQYTVSVYLGRHKLASTEFNVE